MHHRRRCRLSVRSAHRDTTAFTNQSSQDLATMKNWNVGALRGDVLGIASIDRGTHNNRLRPIDVRRIVTDAYRHAFVTQASDKRCFFYVGTAYVCAARKQNARDRAHPDAADADEMDVAHYFSLFRAISESTRLRIVAIGLTGRARSAAALSAA